MSDTFKAGDIANQSGVYKAIHAEQHTPPHYVTAIYGDTFPVCIRCSNRVRFELAVSALHVHAHWNFNPNV